jgi:hypothetical protein
VARLNPDASPPRLVRHGADRRAGPPQAAYHSVRVSRRADRGRAPVIVNRNQNAPLWLKLVQAGRESPFTGGRLMPIRRVTAATRLQACGVAYAPAWRRISSADATRRPFPAPSRATCSLHPLIRRTDHHGPPHHRRVLRHALRGRDGPAALAAEGSTPAPSGSCRRRGRPTPAAAPRRPTTTAGTRAASGDRSATSPFPTKTATPTPRA